MSIFSGLTANTPKHLLLDAGCWVKNFDLSKTFDQQKSNILGATSGGGSFNAVPTIRQYELDGKKGNVKGLQDIEEWAVNMTTTMKETTVETLKIALAAADSSTPSAPVNYTHITPRNELKETDYIDNVAWVGRLANSLVPVIIVLENVLCTSGLLRHGLAIP